MSRILFVFGLMCSFSSLSQGDFVRSFEKHYTLAKEYQSVSLFAESREEINKGIRIAKKHREERNVVVGGIFLAELMRRTGDYNDGLTVLRKLENSIKYPELHAEKLGRTAALYNEGAHELAEQSRYDSVELYLDSALFIAKKFSFTHIQASIYNELGYSIASTDQDSGLFYLQLASDFFLQAKDTHNYVGARTNMFRIYELREDSLNVMRTFNELYELVEGREWNTAEQELFALISSYYGRMGDTANANYWSLRGVKSEVRNLKNTSTSKMNSFRVLYETKEYQNKLKENETRINREIEDKKELILYLIILIGFVFGTAFLLFRERNLKKAISKANERYQMLLVESNHRIKNNLQMVISMLRYTSKGLKASDAKAFEQMSGKIQTISALHKQLYLDVHNERVDLDAYFTAIIQLNNDILLNDFQLTKNISKIEIKSERIVYFGLIFNEMISNTIEHGNGPKKEIVITVQKQDGGFRFVYQDHASFSEDSVVGKGISLIKQLTNKIGGTGFVLDGDIGKYEFFFLE